MSVENTDTGLDDLQDQLKAIEAQCPSSTLIYPPGEAHEQFFKDLCRIYLHASPKKRASIRTAVSDKPGILNCLLGLVYKSAKQIRSVRDMEWLRIGLAAASLENCRFDFRDFLLALAKLYSAAELAGIDPRIEFKAVAAISSQEIPRGGFTPVSEMLSDFHASAVLKEERNLRRERPGF